MSTQKHREVSEAFQGGPQVGVGSWRGIERDSPSSPPFPHSVSPSQTQDQPSEPPSPATTPCGKAPICVPARRDLVDSPASLASSLGSPLPRAKELVLVRSGGGLELTLSILGTWRQMLPITRGVTSRQAGRRGPAFPKNPLCPFQVIFPKWTHSVAPK